MLEFTGDVVILLLRLALVGLLYLFLGSVALAGAREMRKLARMADMGPGTRPPQHPARLLVVDPGATSFTAGEVLPLRPITRLGRAPDCTIILDDTFISGEHAVIVQREGGWWIVDRGSTNGTSVNDQQVRGEVGLQPGDLVGIGDVRLRLVL